jgi:Cu-Zn family superoxide dismutase
MNAWTLAAALLVLSPTAFSYTETKTALAELAAPGYKDFRAHVHLTETSKGIRIVADVRGLAPGSVHGFHIHEKGVCKGPDFESAGDHYNPEKHPHSAPAAQRKHLGDLGNIVANAEGVAVAEVLIPKEKGRDLDKLIHRSIIIHEKADDLATQPAGNAGGRIACGVIKAHRI